MCLVAAPKGAQRMLISLACAELTLTAPLLAGTAVQAICWLMSAIKWPA
jgi:hypothetical protein